MTAETAIPVTYQQPALRIAATYQDPAGGCPESVDIEVHDGPNSPQITPQFIRDVVHSLATMPGVWNRVEVRNETPQAADAATAGT